MDSKRRAQQGDGEEKYFCLLQIRRSRRGKRRPANRLQRSNRARRYPVDKHGGGATHYLGSDDPRRLSYLSASDNTKPREAHIPNSRRVSPPSPKQPSSINIFFVSFSFALAFSATATVTLYVPHAHSPVVRRRDQPPPVLTPSDSGTRDEIHPAGTQWEEMGRSTYRWKLTEVNRTPNGRSKSTTKKRANNFEEIGL